MIRDVIVYEQGNPLQDNFIIAKSGIMRVSANKRFLEFNLKDGWRYQERGNNYGDQQKTEYIRLGFKEYKKQFDLSSFGFANRTPDSANKNNEKMFSMRQLGNAIDSLKKNNGQIIKQTEKDMFRLSQFPLYLDTAWAKAAPDTTNYKKIKSYNDLLPDSARVTVNARVQAQINSLRTSAESQAIGIKDRAKVLRKHKIEWHRKIVLSLACLVLFLVGAPLGSIIRKGGLGTPLVFAIIFFVIFYFANTTGEKMAKENTLTPFTGMWLATFVLVPVGLFLTYKAMRDSQLFNRESYRRFSRVIRGSILRKKIR